MHNQIAHSLFPSISISKIDNVNSAVDEPVKWLGPQHRITRHNANPMMLDSLIVSGGDWQKEMVRQVHLFVDETELGKTLEKVMELNDSLRYLGRNRSNRKHRK